MTRARDRGVEVTPEDTEDVGGHVATPSAAGQGLGPGIGPGIGPGTVPEIEPGAALAAAATEEQTIRHGIWRPFRSLLVAQAVSAALGLVFWVLVAHQVEPHDVGVAAAAISLQTLLGMVTVMGLGVLFVSELPFHEPARQRTMVLRGLLVVLVASVLAGSVVVAVHPFLPGSLREALDNPIGAAVFVAGVVAAGWSLLVDDCALAVRRSSVQVGRNLLASLLRFPVTAVLLALGFTQSHVLQLCWVGPLLVSVPTAVWLLRLPRGDTGSPPLRTDLRTFLSPALRNHGLSLALAAASQMVPVIAGLTLTSVDNAEFAIAWLMATFVFLPPFLLATALFAHGANVTVEEFRRSMERTIPTALTLSLTLCVGAWVLGEPVLLVFGGRYAADSWPILALLVPGGLWIVFKDHLVALCRSQRQFALATRLALAALLLEVVGAAVGGLLGGAIGLCLGWLGAMVTEAVLGAPWLRRAFGGLHWRWRAAPRVRPQVGRAGVQVVAAVVFLVLVGGVGLWSAVKGQGSDQGADQGTGTSTATPSSPGTVAKAYAAAAHGCEPTATRPGPAIDLGVQSATGDPDRPLESLTQVRALIRLARQAGATVISTSGSFRTMQPDPDEPINFRTLDRTIDAAVASGAQVKLQLVGMPRWAFSDATGKVRQAPRTDAELDHWATYVRAVMEHERGKIDYLEVWNEPNEERWWPTGPDALEFVRLLARTYDVVKQVAPATRVVSGGMIGNDLGFLQHLLDAVGTLKLAAPPFDMVGVHPFTGSAPDAVDPADRYQRAPFGLYDENFLGLTGLHDVLVAHGDGDLPIYVSQFGYSTKAVGRVAAVPDAVRAAYLTQALKETTCLPYVPNFSWYALEPSRFDPPSWTMLDDANQPNATYAAMQAWGALVTSAMTSQPVAPSAGASPAASDPPAGSASP